MSFFTRWLGAFGLLTATFNPTGWNYMRWVYANGTTQMPLAVLLGLLLLIGYIIYVGATIRSLGGLGMVLVASVCGALIWVLSDWGLLRLGNEDLVIWAGIVTMSLVLGVGLGWSILRQTLSGQASVDDVEG